MPGAYQRILTALKPTNDELLRDVGASIVSGTVVTISPLTIDIGARFMLTEEFLVLSAFCKPYIQNCETNWYPSNNSPDSPPESNDHKHKIELKLWRGLQVGDKVSMIMASDKQKYYVMEYQGLGG